MNAWDTLSQYLNSFGLGGLTTQLRDWITQGLSEAEIYLKIRDTPEYKIRFAANIERQKQGLPELAESEIVAYEQQARQLMRSVGLPQGFWDQPDDFARLLANDISINELNTRVNDGFLAFENAPAEVKSELARLYGVNAGSIAAYFLDEKRALPILQRQATAARISGASVQSGYGELNQKEAEGLVAQGITPDQASSGFNQLAQQRELFSAQGTELDSIGRDEQLDAAFKGNANAQERIRRKAESRKSQFGTGNGYATNQRGAVGIGTANS